MSCINKEKESELSLDTLYNELDYNPVTGWFTWKTSRVGVKRGKRAGSVKKDGSRKIRLKGEEYLEHRLVWFYVYGKWPNSILDHINRDRTDNRISNLKEATTRENSRNRPDNSKYGHNIYKANNNFYISIQHNGIDYYYGVFTHNRAKEVRDWIFEYLNIFGNLPKDNKELAILLEQFT